MDFDKMIMETTLSTLLDSDTSASSESSSDDDYEYEIVRQSESIIKIQYFVENVVSRYNLRTFKSHFRMTKEIAYYLIDRLENSIFLPQHTYGREKVTCQKGTFRQISDRFDVSLSSSHRIIVKVLNFLLSLRLEFIQWPVGEESAPITKLFKKRQGIDNVIGAIDGCHVQIRRPQHHEDSYVNRNGYHSVLLQGTVDSRKRFIDVYCGEPGSIHDARLLRKSSIYAKAEQDQNIFGNKFLLGDSAYPSRSCLIPPFKDNGHLTQNQKRFNFKHSSTRIVVEHTFGLLKGRFRRLQKIDNLNINTSVKIIMACCVLHNICEIRGDDTFIEPYNVSGDVSDEPEVWSYYTTQFNRREEIFYEMFPEGQE